jgi:integrase
MAAPLVKTKTPGIYKRGSRYVVIWRHRGKQYKSFHRTLAEAREAKGQRQSGSRRPSTKQPFAEYARSWLDGYQGRTARGFSDQTRSDYRRSIEHYAIPFFDGSRLCDIEQPDVRRLISSLQARGLAASSVRKNIAPVKALFATACEDGDLALNPALGVRVNARQAAEDATEERAKAMTRVELGAVLTLPERWRLLFELLAHTGLRISELLGLDWADLELGDRPRLRVRRQYYRGTLKHHLKTEEGRRELPLSPGMARKLWTARPPRACARHGYQEGRRPMGGLSRVQALVRVDAAGVREEHPPGRGLARPYRSGIHPPGLHAFARFRARRRSVPRRSR